MIKVIKGSYFLDSRGLLVFNNNFNEYKATFNPDAEGGPKLIDNPNFWCQNTSMTIWQAAGLIHATLIVSIPNLKVQNLEQLFICFLIAVTGTLTHFCLNAALARAEISSLLPLDFLRLIWSVSLGFVFFSEVPLNTIWLGSALIIIATTYIAYRQVKKSKLTSKEINTNI